MNKKSNNELINTKYRIMYIIKNLNIHNISFDNSTIKNAESNLVTINISNNTEKIYKTMNSLIIKKNNKLYCYNNNYYRQMAINSYETIYSSNSFYVKINSNNNNIVFIDNDFNTKRTYATFTINNIITKDNFVVISGVNNNILINNKHICKFIDHEVVDLYNYILFYNVKNYFVINNDGYLINSNTNNTNNTNTNIKIILDAITRFGTIENLIRCYINENYLH